MVARSLQATPQRSPRPDALRNLARTYDAAVERIASEPRSWLTHPRPYPDLARYGFRCIKLHRYWFADQPGLSPIMTNSFDEAGDIPKHLSVETQPSAVA